MNWLMVKEKTNNFSYLIYAVPLLQIFTDRRCFPVLPYHLNMIVDKMLIYWMRNYLHELFKEEKGSCRQSKCSVNIHTIYFSSMMDYIAEVLLFGHQSL